MKTKKEQPKRQKPPKADFYGWLAFVLWAEENGVSEHPDDQQAWWECWVAAYKAGVNGFG